jgi:hypothetical protein
MTRTDVCTATAEARIFKNTGLHLLVIRFRPGKRIEAEPSGYRATPASSLRYQPMVTEEIVYSLRAPFPLCTEHTNERRNESAITLRRLG